MKLSSPCSKSARFIFGAQEPELTFENRQIGARAAIEPAYCMDNGIFICKLVCPI